MIDALETQEFYELMQQYRHAPVHEQDVVCAAFLAVKKFVRDHAPSLSPVPVLGKTED